MIRCLVAVAPVLAIAGWLTAAPAAAQSSDTVYGAAVVHYQAGLNAVCPQKRLDLVAPGELPDDIDDFESRLDRETVTSIKRAAQSLPGGGDKRCPGVGAACGSHTRLAAYDQLALLAKFVAFMCALPERCSAQSTCDTPR